MTNRELFSEKAIKAAQLVPRRAETSSGFDPLDEVNSELELVKL